MILHVKETKCSQSLLGRRMATVQQKWVIDEIVWWWWKLVHLATLYLYPSKPCMLNSYFNKVNYIRDVNIQPHCWYFEMRSWLQLCCNHWTKSGKWRHLSFMPSPESAKKNSSGSIRVPSAPSQRCLNTVGQDFLQTQHSSCILPDTCRTLQDRCVQQ